jgi:hypothetical protein
MQRDTVRRLVVVCGLVAGFIAFGGLSCNQGSDNPGSGGDSSNPIDTVGDENIFTGKLLRNGAAVATQFAVNNKQTSDWEKLVVSVSALDDTEPVGFACHISPITDLASIKVGPITDCYYDSGTDPNGAGIKESVCYFFANGVRVGYAYLGQQCANSQPQDAFPAAVTGVSSTGLVLSVSGEMGTGSDGYDTADYRMGIQDGALELKYCTPGTGTCSGHDTCEMVCNCGSAAESGHPTCVE